MKTLNSKQIVESKRQQKLKKVEKKPLSLPPSDDFIFVWNGDWDIILDVDDTDLDGNPVKGAILPRLEKFRNTPGVGGVGKLVKIGQAADNHVRWFGKKFITDEMVADLPGYENGFNNVNETRGPTPDTCLLVHTAPWEKVMVNSNRVKIDWNEYKYFVDYCIDQDYVQMPSFDEIESRMDKIERHLAMVKQHTDPLFIKVNKARMVILQRYKDAFAASALPATVMETDVKPKRKVTK